MPFDAWGFVPEGKYRRRQQQRSSTFNTVTEESTRGNAGTHRRSTTESSALLPSDGSNSAPPPPLPTWTSSETVGEETEELRDIEDNMESTKLDDIPETEGTALPPPPTDAITGPLATEGGASQVPTETNFTKMLPSMTDTRAGLPAGGLEEPDIDWVAIDRVSGRHERRKNGATTTRPSSTRDTNTSMRSFWFFGAPPKSKNSRTKASSNVKSGRGHEPLKRRNTAPPTSPTSGSRRTGTVRSTQPPSTLDVRTISLSIDGQTLDDLLADTPKPNRRTNSGFSLYAKPKKAAPFQSKSWVTEVTIPKEDDDLSLLSWMNKGGFTWPSEQPEDWDPIEKAPTGVRFDKMDESKRLSRLWPNDRDDLKRWAWERFIDYRRGLDQTRAEQRVAESSKGPGDDIPPAALEPADGE